MTIITITSEARPRSTATAALTHSNKMAPRKPTADAHPTGASVPNKVSAALTEIKSTLQRTKAKLRTYNQSKVTKTSAKGKAVNERDSLKQMTGRLSAVKEAVGNMAASSSGDELRSDTGASSLTGSPQHYPPLTAHDFEVGGTLGRGKFGRVFLARHMATNYVCALKIISKAQASTGAEERLIRRELEIHKNLAHKNILKLLAWFHDEKSVYLVLEYAPNGNLFSKLNKQPKSRFTEEQTAIYMTQIASALRYMHSKNIMHRDIKPENILLGLHSEIKLADFGYSVHSESGHRSTVCGTLDYLSPEVAVMLLKPGMSDGWYTKAIDQWSLGVLMYELLVGRAPFEMPDTKSTQRRIANYQGKGLKIPGHLLNLDAEKRMSLDDVLRHRWVVGRAGKAVSSGPQASDQLLQTGA
ncbi:serine threonine- kinase ark1 [Pyrenophora seminiperda CCB06]|uniref:Aurora kinase n=1 Tax=Pyrenophora seminiperda CCB06 TaxID=1302712 RepID=A0A3M7LVD3_9PLEO|nr:serine threonine- kinase ark1 [Pyrenophora seminiperda CCB06]